ncbi:MAG TPA: PP2C family protein-serine/threonine phosphatase [Thermoanaerobaculia bacterium]|nr:PP2C family protein-serine/threonine phosphatase [Thermoanaerobaculia bacterium]
MTTQTLTPARRSYGWRTWRDAGRESIIAVLIGVLAAWVEKRNPGADVVFRYALLALAIVLDARGMETALSWAIEQSRMPTFFRIVIYILGGGIAFFLIAGMTFDLVDSLIVVLLTALIIGFILHHNRKRADRLRASIERLKEHEFAEKELEIAREMQYRLLAPQLIERDGFRVSARTHAAHIVGGDFYDVLRLSDDQSAILAADVSGKGIAASLIMASCKAMIPFLAANGSAAEVMRALNARLCEQLQRREFVAMVLVRFDARSGMAEIVNAGMPDPLIAGSNGARSVVCNGERLPLGAMRATKYESTTIVLAPGERLLLLSDGLAEATVDGAPIGHERIDAIAARAATVDALIDEVRAIPGVQIEDDVTVVWLERLT